MVERLSAWAGKALMFRDGTHASGCVSAIGVCHVDSAGYARFAPSSALRDPSPAPRALRRPSGSLGALVECRDVRLCRARDRRSHVQTPWGALASRRPSGTTRLPHGPFDAYRTREAGPNFVRGYLWPFKTQNYRCKNSVDSRTAPSKSDFIAFKKGVGVVLRLGDTETIFDRFVPSRKLFEHLFRDITTIFFHL